MSDQSSADHPVRRGEVRGAAPNPTDTVAPVSALRTVLLYSVAMPFALVPEEIMWAGYHMDKILAPLLGKTPQVVTLAVRQEMLEGNYSRALAVAEQQTSASAAFDASVAHADINDWAAVLMGTITQCYSLRPMEESAMHGQLVGLLRELGVGDLVNPRGSRYLPNDVRHRLANQNGDRK